MTLRELFKNIANAIRSKTGSSATIKATDFATQINSLPNLSYTLSNNVLTIKEK